MKKKLISILIILAIFIGSGALMFGQSGYDFSADNHDNPDGGDGWWYHTGGHAWWEDDSPCQLFEVGKESYDPSDKGTCIYTDASDIASAAIAAFSTYKTNGLALAHIVDEYGDRIDEIEDYKSSKTCMERYCNDTDAYFVIFVGNN